VRIGFESPFQSNPSPAFREINFHNAGAFPLRVDCQFRPGQGSRKLAGGFAVWLTAMGGVGHARDHPGAGACSAIVINRRPLSKNDNNSIRTPPTRLHLGQDWSFTSSEYGYKTSFRMGQHQSTCKSRYRGSCAYNSSKPLSIEAVITLLQMTLQALWSRSILMSLRIVPSLPVMPSLRNQPHLPHTTRTDPNPLYRVCISYTTSTQGHCRDKCRSHWQVLLPVHIGFDSPFQFNPSPPFREIKFHNASAFTLRADRRSALPRLVRMTCGPRSVSILSGQF
jgi:hypothetical protein